MIRNERFMLVQIILNKRFLRLFQKHFKTFAWNDLSEVRSLLASELCLFKNYEENKFMP